MAAEAEQRRREKLVISLAKTRVCTRLKRMQKCIASDTERAGLVCSSPADSVAQMSSKSS